MAYVQTTTVDFKGDAERISQNFGIVTGKTDITTYNTTGVEITEITSLFKNAPRVIADGFSDNLYGIRWDTTDKCFHAFSTGTSADGPFNEEADGTDVGEVNWIAMGDI